MLANGETDRPVGMTPNLRKLGLGLSITLAYRHTDGAIGRAPTPERLDLDFTLANRKTDRAVCDRPDPWVLSLTLAELLFVFLFLVEFEALGSYLDLGGLRSSLSDFGGLSRAAIVNGSTGDSGR